MKANIKHTRIIISKNANKLQRSNRRKTLRGGDLENENGENEFDSPPNIPLPQTPSDTQDTKISHLEYSLNQCNAELRGIKFPDAPPEIQVKSAGKFPIIKPRYLFAQLRDLGLNYANIDTRLTFLAKMNKPDSSSANSLHLFYKFNVTPPEDEPEFEAVTSSGALRMPYPAVLIIRCVLNGDNLKIMAVYVVAGTTDVRSGMMSTNTFELRLDNLVKLETEEEYLKRTKPNDDNPAPIMGKHTNLVLNTSTMTLKSSNVDNLIAFIKNEQQAIGGNVSEYALRRFNIVADERRIMNTVKDLIRPSSPPTSTQDKVGTLTASTAKAGIGTLFKNMFQAAVAGGKRSKFKHSTKKSKRNANAWRRVNATKHKRLKGFK